MLIKMLKKSSHESLLPPILCSSENKPVRKGREEMNFAHLALDQPWPRKSEQLTGFAKKIHLQKPGGTRHQWCMPVILATWEAKIKRIVILLPESQPKNIRKPAQLSNLVLAFSERIQARQENIVEVIGKFIRKVYYTFNKLKEGHL
jgi:hypothetical protein